MSTPDLEQDFCDWIGREEEAEEQLTSALAKRFYATLGLPGEAPAMGEVAPRLIHFCLCQPAARMDALGEDGHPARGGFLPPIPLLRRMWAGSELCFTGELRVGETVRRRSRVVDVVFKEGRSGRLWFVTVHHQIESSGEVQLQELQTIVYREAAHGAVRGKGPREPAPASAALQISADPTLLFRYSALTFNGHRIHYDRSYATEIEGYSGLVVHGPLQATMLLHFAAQQQGGVAPDSFMFRGEAPLFDTEPIVLNAGECEDGIMKLWTASPDGGLALSAEARWGQ